MLSLAQNLAEHRRQLTRRHFALCGLLGGALLLILALSLMLGQSFTPPGDVIGILLGVAGSEHSFAVGQLRLPRAVLSILAGSSFGLAGAAFQTMLRNPLASPDIIGISPAPVLRPFSPSWCCRGTVRSYRCSRFARALGLPS
jgi:iron complex transport system permease protein